jgi:hypothetical protein
MNGYYFAAGVITLAVAIAHVGCIVFGSSWYRFFGAGEQMARWADADEIKPTLITSGIVFILLIWSVYAFSGAWGLTLPLNVIAIKLIGLVLVMRGLLGFVLLLKPIGRSRHFWVWSSLFCLALGLLYLNELFHLVQ